MKSITELPFSEIKKSKNKGTSAKNLNLSSKNLVISSLHEKRTELDINKIKKLRQSTGTGFKDCSAALQEGNGNI